MYPSLAERARTAVALARTAALTTYPRHARPVLTNAAVREEAGRLVLSLPADGEVARTLALRPLATVRVAPAGCELTTLQGGVRRLPQQQARTSRFVLEPGSVRVGCAPREAVDAGEYWAAEPDPLRADAPEVLAHLRGRHAQSLADCLRAQGHAHVRWVEAAGLDRYGLDLTVVDDEGVGRVRLAFAAPLRSVEELAPRLSLTLRARCQDCPQQREGRH